MTAVDYVLVSTGIACLIAAIVGGGLKAFGTEIPQLASVRRQMLLGALGMLLLGVGLWSRPGGQAPAPDDPPKGVESNLSSPTAARTCGDAAPLAARLANYVRSLAEPGNPTDVEIRMAKLRRVGLAMALPPSALTGNADDVVDAILDRITTQATGPCPEADLVELIRQIEQQTGEVIPSG